MKRDGWRQVLITTTTSSVIALVLAAGAAVVISGVDAGLSAAAGGGLVVVLSFLSLALIDWADRHRPQWAIPLFMIGFGTKVAVLAVAIPLVQPGDWLHPAWALGTGIAVLILWQVAEVWSFRRMRLTVEPAGSSASA